MGAIPVVTHDLVKRPGIVVVFPHAEDDFGKVFIPGSLFRKFQKVAAETVVLKVFTDINALDL